MIFWLQWIVHLSYDRCMKAFVIIPCVADKQDAPCYAVDMYTSDNFRNTLAAARSDSFAGAQVLILSALYGLVTLDTLLYPYDLKMGDQDCVTAETVAIQAEALGLTWSSDVYALLPAAYFAVLNEALRSLDVYPQNVYEAAPGIGYQREVVGCIRRA